MTRSSSWARSPSPSACTSTMSATTSRSTSATNVETPQDLGVLGVVAEVDQGDELAGDVAVLAPPGDLVVAQLGVDVENAGALGVLVDLRLPPQRRPPRRGPVSPVDERDGAADAPGDLLGARSRVARARPGGAGAGRRPGPPTGRHRGRGRSPRARRAAGRPSPRGRPGAGGCRPGTGTTGAPTPRPGATSSPPLGHHHQDGPGVGGLRPPPRRSPRCCPRTRRRTRASPVPTKSGGS